MLKETGGVSDPASHRSETMPKLLRDPDIHKKIEKGAA